LPVPPLAASLPAGPAEPLRPRRLLLLLAILAMIAAGGALVDAAIERNAPAVARGFVRGDLRVAGVSSHVLLTRLTLTGVSWKGPDGAPLLSARRVSIDWSLLSLLRRGIVLDRLTLEQPRLSLSRAAGGGWNVLEAIPALAAPPGGRAAPVVIDRLVIDRGALRLSDRARDAALALDGVSTHVALGLPRLAVRGEAAASGGALTRAGKRRPLGPLRLAAHLDGGALAIDDARVSLGASHLRAEGRVGKAIDLSDLDLRMRGDLAAEDLRTFVPALDRLHGAITLDARVTGSASRPRSRGALRGGRARAGAFEMDALRARFDYVRPVLRVFAIDVAALGGRSSGSGTIDTSRRDYRVHLRSREISGSRLVNLVLAGPAFENARARVGRRAQEGIYERLEGTIDLAGSGFAPERAKGTASFLFRSPGHAPGTAGEFVLDGLVRVERGELRFDRIRLDSVDLRVRVGNPGTPPGSAGAELRPASDPNLI